MDKTNGCIEWPGALDGKGYGTATIDKKQYGVHRLAFYLHNAYWPKTCRHLCGNPKCINGAHLADGSKGDNNRDTVLQGRNRNAAKTHCRFGHEFTEENTYREPGQPTKRYCRECRRLRASGGLENLDPIDNRPTLNEPKSLIPLSLCPRGHLMTKENTWYTGGRAKCRACQGIANRKSKYRREMRAAGFPEAEIEAWIAEQDWTPPPRPRARRKLMIPETYSST